MHALFFLVLPVIFEWFQLYRTAVTSCIVHCNTCFLHINLILLSFRAKIKKNDPRITLHAKRDTYEEDSGNMGMADVLKFLYNDPGSSMEDLFANMGIENNDMWKAAEDQEDQ